MQTREQVEVVPVALKGSAWLNALSNGLTTSAAALAFIDSPEHQANVVQGYYQLYLGRMASAPEVGGWVNAMQHGAGEAQIIAAFVSSPEYYQKHNANVADWLFGAYQNVLSRQPDQGGYNSWLNMLQARESAV